MKITIQDVRSAIAYVHQFDVEKLNDEQLLKSDFWKDLGMGNIRVTNVWIDLQRRYNILLPIDVFHNMKDNTVGAFLESVNQQLAD